MIHWDCKGWGDRLQFMTLSCLQLAHPGFLPPENVPNKADLDQYKLLCPDNTQSMPVDKYKDCHLAQVPSHAVVARSVGGKENLIWELLNQAQVLNSLFSLLLSALCLDLRHFPTFPSCHYGIPCF